MSTFMHWQQDAREIKYSHAPGEADRTRKVRKPIYSRSTGRSGSLSGIGRRRTKRSF